VFLLPLLYEFLEPSRRLTLEVDSDVCDSSVRDGFCRSTSRTSRFLSLDADSPLLYCVGEYQHFVSIRIAR
jgi:hypothetical protein